MRSGPADPTRVRSPPASCRASASCASRGPGRSGTGPPRGEAGPVAELGDPSSVNRVGGRSWPASPRRSWTLARVPAPGAAQRRRGSPARPPWRPPPRLPPAAPQPPARCSRLPGLRSRASPRRGSPSCAGRSPTVPPRYQQSTTMSARRRPPTAVVGGRRRAAVTVSARETRCRGGLRRRSAFRSAGCSRSFRAVPQRGRDHQFTPTSDPHPQDAFFPSVDHLPVAEREAERFGALPGGVEFLAGLEVRRRSSPRPCRAFSAPVPMMSLVTSSWAVGLRARSPPVFRERPARRRLGGAVVVCRFLFGVSDQACLVLVAHRDRRGSARAASGEQGAARGPPSRPRDPAGSGDRAS